MNDSAYSRLACIVLIIHGCIELSALLMLVLPPEFIPVSLSEDSIFWALIGAMYGTLRVISGFAIAKGKKNAIVFGMILSTVTMVVSPSIQPFGLMDLPLSALVLWALLALWYSDGNTD